MTEEDDVRCSSLPLRLRQILLTLDGEIAKRHNLRSLVEALDAARPDTFQCFSERIESEIAAKTLTLKILNLCLAKYHYLAQTTTLVSRPFGLLVDPSNYCNLQCPGCVHSPTIKSQFLWDRATLAPDRFQTFARRYGPYATHIQFCNYGEPLLNPGTPALVRLARTYMLDTVLSTNLSMGRLDAEAYVECGLDFMVLSIDGATQPVYERYRRNGKIDVVYQNIRKLVEAKRKLRSRTPVLRWQFLAFEHNEHEIPSAIKMARELGVDYIHICTPDDRSWDDPQIRTSRAQPLLMSLNGSQDSQVERSGYPLPADIDAEIIAREFDTPWEQRLEGTASESLYEPVAPSEHTCKWLYTSLTMDATGRIIPCCSAPSLGRLGFWHVWDGQRG